MSRGSNVGGEGPEFLTRLAQPTSRRRFLQWSGVSVAVAVAGCSTDEDGPLAVGDKVSSDHVPAGAIYLGAGNFAVLNYAYALEQLEADFYTRAIGTPAFNGLSSEGQEVFRDLRAHEVIHRDYLKAAITALGGTPLPMLDFTYPEGVFTSTEALLETARAFEDLGVSAYNGAGQLFSNDDLGRTLLTVAGKIVSVEARHASAVRDLISPRTSFFAGEDVINEQGLDVVRVPSMVLPIANTFFVADITDQNVLYSADLPNPAYVPESPTALMFT